MSNEIFISHAWGNDSDNRDNHIRCGELCNILKTNGYSVWFDTYDMSGNIDSCIMSGINNCKVVLLCLTEKYFNKINNAVHGQVLNDNCYKEWNYSLFKQKKIIPLIMDSKTSNVYLNTDGVIQMYLNSCLYVDMSKNLIDEIKLLYQTLKKYEVYNKNEKKFMKIKPNTSLDNLLTLLSKKLETMSSPNNSPRKILSLGYRRIRTRIYL
mgnify:FL=1